MSIPAYDVPRHPASDACLDFLCLLWSPARYAVKTLYLLLSEELQLSPPQKLPVSYVFLRSAAHYLPVYGIISWCPMCRLLQTSDSANSLLEIQATSTSIYYTFIFGMFTQNLELREMEPAIKFRNWIRRSSWEYRYSLIFNT